jgi:hypothetical protein
MVIICQNIKKFVLLANNKANKHEYHWANSGKRKNQSNYKEC